MTRLLAGLVALTLVGDARANTTPTPILEVSGDGSTLNIGEPVAFGVFGADPYTRIWLALSLTGPGAGPCGPGGLCLDITGPFYLLRGSSGITSTRIWTLGVPNWLAGQTVCAQGFSVVNNLWSKSAVECRDILITGETIWSDGTEYLFTDHLMTHTEATAACASVGMDLVTPTEEAEDVFLRDTLASYGRLADPWLGVNDLDAEGVFVDPWGSLATWLPWSTGEPDNAGDEDCATQLDDGTWSDAWCGGLRQVVCEASP